MSIDVANSGMAPPARYRALTLLGQGGMAQVWAAEHQGPRGLTRLVAQKRIRPEYANQPRLQALFLNEVRIAGELAHPNVCRVLDMGEDAEGLFLALELVDGDSLAALLREGGKLTPELAAFIVAEAAAGLHAAHERGVVHRDVSPHNLLVGSDGHVKVADFGIAKAPGAQLEATGTDERRGRLAYMAPERFGPRAADARVDVFALGCVLYEASTGVRAFAGDDDVQVMAKVTVGAFLAPTMLADDYPGALEAIVQRALAPSRDDRQPTAHALREELLAFLASRPVAPTPRDVAAVVRARLHPLLEERRSRIARCRESAPPASVRSPTTARDLETRVLGKPAPTRRRGVVAAAAFTALGVLAMAAGLSRPRIVAPIEPAEIAPEAIESAPMEPTPVLLPLADPSPMVAAEPAPVHRRAPSPPPKRPRGRRAEPNPY